MIIYEPCQGVCDYETFIDGESYDTHEYIYEFWFEGLDAEEVTGMDVGELYLDDPMYSLLKNEILGGFMPNIHDKEKYRLFLMTKKKLKESWIEYVEETINDHS